MAMVVVDDSSLYRRTHSPCQMAWSEGRRPLGAVLHSSNEPSELSQLPCGLDYSTIIIIIIIRTVVIKDIKSNNKCHMSCHVMSYRLLILCVVYAFQTMESNDPVYFCALFLSNVI